MKFDFPNDRGEILSGRLELPAGRPRAYALFAHCFTCSKEVKSAGVIARTLAQKGFAVLRFDFTGLGGSQGDFSNTNFSSNTEDLISACSHLAGKYAAPELLIGHSFGGAAVLQAATRLKEVKAVVTIAAPSDVNHLTRLFKDDVDTIEEKGEAKVKLAGRTFTLKKQLLEDLEKTQLLEGVRDFRKALLVMHAPHDNVVSIDHAANIFQAAKHPKSFVTLDTADHLLSSPSDARYVADVCASWVERYLSPVEEAKENMAEKTVRVISRDGARYTQDIYAGEHHLLADEPVSAKGDNLGMNPYEFLLAGLGACTSMTMKMYAERKGFPLQGVTVELSHEKIHAEDCGECDTTEGKIDKIVKSIELRGDLSKEERKRLLEIAEKCPVNRTLKSEILIDSDPD